MTQHIVTDKPHSENFSHDFFTRRNKYLSLCRLFLLLLVALVFQVSPVRAGESAVNIFTVFLNNVPHSASGTVRPCVPLMARFAHPDPHVTRVRMRYPYNHEMFMFFPLNQDVHIVLHEDYMKKGEWSLSDFIAEDESGSSYGQMTLTFQPLDPLNNGACESFPDS